MTEQHTQNDPLGLSALAAGEPAPDMDAIFDGLDAQVTAETGPLAWLRSRRPVLQRTLAGGAVALIALVSFVLSGRVDIAVYPGARLALELGALSVMALSVMWVGLRPVFRAEVDPTLARAILAVTLLLPFALAALPMAHVDHPASLAGAGSDLVDRAWRCLAYGLATAAPVALLVAGMDTLVGAGRQRARLLASAAGAGGLLALTLHCPITQPVHLLVSHAPVVVLTALIYMSVARRLPG